jgi:hypothetical protein
MSTSTAKENSGISGGADNRAAGPFCEAQDLKRILTLLADQIADADRRHSDALSVMQERLEHLGQTAEGLKAQAPQDILPVIDRIQDNMAALSEQIASASAGRSAQTEAAPGFRGTRAFAGRSRSSPRAALGHGSRRA